MSLFGWLRRLWHGEPRIETTSRWDRAMDPGWIDTIMSIPVTDRFHAKQGRSTGRLMLPTPQGERLVIYLKRHYQLPWWQRLLALCGWLGPWTPAAQEWEHLHWSLKQGLAVPEPLALGEFLGPGLRVQSFLAIAELTDMLALNEALPLIQQQMTPTEFRAWKQDVIAEMARITGRLHEAKWYHKDLYLCHFYLSPLAPRGGEGAGVRGLKPSPRNAHALHGSNPLTPTPSPPREARGEIQIYLIDLHRLGHHPWLGWRWQVKDLAQLLYSSYIPGVTVQDRLRFLREYLRCRKLDAAGRRLLRAVRAKAGAYQRHNAKRETHEDRAVPRKSAA